MENGSTNYTTIKESTTNFIWDTPPLNRGVNEAFGVEIEGYSLNRFYLMENQKLESFLESQEIDSPIVLETKAYEKAFVTFHPLFIANFEEFNKRNCLFVAKIPVRFWVKESELNLNSLLEKVEAKTVELIGSKPNINYERQKKPFGLFLFKAYRQACQNAHRSNNGKNNFEPVNFEPLKIGLYKMNVCNDITLYCYVFSVRCCATAVYFHVDRSDEISFTFPDNKK